MKRRSFCTGATAGLLAAALARAAAATTLPETAGFAAEQRRAPIGSLRNHVTALAQSLSLAPHQPRSRDLPPALAALDYDDYNRISFNNHMGLWRDGPSGFEAQPMHRGTIQSQDMRLNIVTDGRVQRLRYDPALFSFFGIDPPDTAGRDIGYSGLKLLGHTQAEAIAREFAVFQGASYFRALAGDMVYGLSARGLALRTGDPGGEEFPAFTDLWLEAPAPDATQIILHALLDGPSVTGAYRFTMATGPDLAPDVASAPAQPATRMAVEATLFPRVDLLHVGLAPLTSMYWFAPLERGGADDYRPRVHDSDGLAICTSGGDWHWRPLANPAKLLRSTFAGGGIRGFGLAQRERRFAQYQDIQAAYHDRPSCWITPRGPWPRGHVELIEIPTDSEYHDNIVAYWRPADPMPAGQRVDFGYDVEWSATPPAPAALLQIRASTSGAHGSGHRQIIIDFATPHGGTAGPQDDIVPEVRAAGGRASAVSLGPNPVTGGLRLSFLAEVTGDSADVSAVLLRGGQPVSERWRYPVFAAV